MSMRVLIVHPDNDMIMLIEELLDEVHEAEGCDLSWSHAKSEVEARRKASAGGHLSLVVTSLEIPEHDRPLAGAGEQHRRGLKLVRELREANPEIAAILTTGQADNEIVAFTQSENVGLVQEGAGFKEQLQSEVVRRLGLGKPEAPSRIDLEFSLATDERCGWRFHRGGKTLSSGRLDVERGRLARLVEESRDVRLGNHRWERDLRQVGEALGDELFKPTPDNLKFRDTFHELKGQAGGIQNIRVRFTVPETLHPIVLEALKRRAEDDDSWMLQTAVYRAQEPGTDPKRPPGLFQDEQTRERPINFLVIQADLPYKAIARSEVEDLELTLDPLPNVEEEVTAVEELLSNLKKEARPIGKVCVINRKAVSPDHSFKQLVEDVLSKGPWHVLHYAGHTYYDFQHRAGYLFFPRGNDQLEPIKIDYFAWLLRNADTRFVFLSSCEGGQQDFIYHLSKEHVPAIMGFLWNVNDPTAKLYAVSFYRHLLCAKERSLEYACLEAKKEMHARDVHNPIWASAVLVMQVAV